MKPPTKRRRSFCGASWINNLGTLSVSYHCDADPSRRDDYYGFRTAQSGCRQPLKGNHPP